MASLTYDSFFDDLCNNNVKPSTDTVKGMLVTNAYSANKGTHTKRSDITNEVTGTGYTAGGVTVPVTLAKDTTNHKETLTFTAVNWATSTITARGIVLYKSRGGAASADELYCYVDFGADITDTNGTFTATFSTPLTIQN